MYSENDYRLYLEHHGIPGQKWGVRNGPPYPLDAAGKQKRIMALSKELDNEWDYGVLHNGNKITDINNFDFGKNYRTISIETLKKEKIDTCWDFVNYENHVCNQLGLKTKCYMFVMQKSDDPNDVVTHTFLTYENDGKQYWLESAAWPKRGLHEINNYKDAISELNDMYKNDGSKAYSVFEYDPKGMDKGLTDQEFFDRATQNLVEDHSRR